MNYNIQAPPAGVMIRPHRFALNPETAADNAFQSADSTDPAAIASQAMSEFDDVVTRLTGAGVRIHVFDDFGERDTPDSVFPNNWFSTHHGGHVALYPMYSPSRRRERRPDVIEMLKSRYRVQEVVDFSGLEVDGLYLEGTGAMVLDHLERVAYVSSSHRADPIVLERFCTLFGFEPMAFDTADAHGQPIYHTNVIMSIATDYVIICLEMLTNAARRAEVAERLAATGRELIVLNREQVSEFAGNALEMTGAGHRVLALSTRAAAALTAEQRATIARSATLLPLHIPTIERAGGSVRCMIAGIHLTAR